MQETETKNTHRGTVAREKSERQTTSPAQKQAEEKEDPGENKHDATKVHKCKCGIQKMLPGGETGSCNRINNRVVTLSKDPSAPATNEDIEAVRNLLKTRMPQNMPLPEAEILGDPNRKIHNADLIKILLAFKELRIKSIYSFLEGVGNGTYKSFITPELRKAVIELLQEEEIIDGAQAKELSKKSDSRNHSFDEFTDAVHSKANFHLAALRRNMEAHDAHTFDLPRSAQTSTDRATGALDLPTLATQRRIKSTTPFTADSNSAPEDVRSSDSYDFNAHTMAKEYAAILVDFVIDHLRRRKKEEADDANVLTQSEHRIESRKKISEFIARNPAFRQALARANLDFTDIDHLPDDMLRSLAEQIEHAHLAYRRIA